MSDTKFSLVRQIDNNNKKIGTHSVHVGSHKKINELS